MIRENIWQIHFKMGPQFMKLRIAAAVENKIKVTSFYSLLNWATRQMDENILQEINFCGNSNLRVLVSPEGRGVSFVHRTARWQTIKTNSSSDSTTTTHHYFFQLQNTRNCSLLLALLKASENSRETYQIKMKMYLILALPLAKNRCRISG